MVTEWIAEPVNTVTNVVFILLPLGFLAAHKTSYEAGASMEPNGHSQLRSEANCTVDSIKPHTLRVCVTSVLPDCQCSSS
eukprot:6106871-Amphidinium_carterae.1